jgi:hypothetical protein
MRERREKWATNQDREHKVITRVPGEDVRDYSIEKFWFFLIFWEKIGFFRKKMDFFGKKLDFLEKIQIFSKKSNFSRFFFWGKIGFSITR